MLSRPGRITNFGHVFTIVRNVVGEQAVSGVGKIQMLTDAESDQTVRLFATSLCVRISTMPMIYHVRAASRPHASAAVSVCGMS